MIIPPNITALAEKNTALLEKLGFDSMFDNPFELNTAEVFSKSGLFPIDAVGTIFSDPIECDIRAVTPVTRLNPRLGMVLIRPDFIHATARVESFIAKRFTIIDSAAQEVGPRRYWEIYKDAIIGRETRYSRLTRAAVYVGSPCRLIVFEEPSDTDHEVATADYVYDKLKGKQGIQQPNTLRGDVIYKTAIETGFHDLKKSVTARAVDPFGAYQKIVSDGKEFRSNLVHPLLFFTGVGLHVPTHEEMKLDLGTLKKDKPDSDHILDRIYS